MSGAFIKTLANIRYRRPVTTSQQITSNNSVVIHAEAMVGPSEAYVRQKVAGLASHFEERAAIREFDGNQSKVEAELGAIEEVIPFLEMLNGCERLVLPVNAPAKYRWWQGGQELEVTLRELGASEVTISKYVSQLGGANSHD